jgi:hypothetical protein
LPRLRRRVLADAEGVQGGEGAGVSYDWPTPPNVTEPVPMSLEFAQAAAHALDIYQRRSLTRIERFQRSRSRDAALNIAAETRLLEIAVQLRKQIMKAF